MELKATLASRGDVQSWFDAMASCAINRSVLVAAGKRLRVTEVEFYLNRADHPDPYVHRSDQQLNTSGSWYFHREKSAKIGFTLKGLDLTFGEAGAEYGGMLIRAAHDGVAHIEGPSKVVDAILVAAEVKSVTDLKRMDAYCDSAFDAGGILRFESRPEDAAFRIGPPETVYVASRIGLKGGKAYADAPYRYRAYPTVTKKEKSRILAGRRIAPSEAAPAPRYAPLSDDEIGELLGI